MLRTVREASSQLVARVVGSRFAKPIARVAVAAAGLLLLAFIGKSAVAGALASPPAPPPALVSMPPSTSASADVPAAAPPHAPADAPSPAPTPASTSTAEPSPAAHGHASAEDPVILNTANIDDLRRLPGVGEKRATAIVALRTRLGGRFHAVEDLLKVKGIGRATLRRLRPLVRLDAPAVPDGGSEAPR
jgi:competence protein ComEA